jgi:hypothetical protein
MRTVGTERTPENAPLLVRPDPGAAETVAAMQHAQQHKAQNRRQGIAPPLALARVWEGRELAE